MKKYLFAVSFFYLLSGCANDNDSKTQNISVNSFSLKFSLINIDQEPAYNSYDEYLVDTTQVPHSPIIKLANGGSIPMKFQMYTGGSDTSVAGSHFILRDNSSLISSLVESSLDSSARCLIHWSNSKKDTLIFYSYNPSGLRSPRQARLIIYNGDTVFNEIELYLNEKYQLFYSTNTIPVILNPTGN